MAEDKKTGIVARAGESTRYALTVAITVPVLLAASEAYMRNEHATAIAYTWCAVAATGVYVLGESLKSFAEKFGK